MFLVLNIIKKAYISGWSSQCASIVLNVHLRTLTVSMATGVSSQWLHLYLHTSLQFGRRKTVCDKRSMSEFTVKKRRQKVPRSRTSDVILKCAYNGCFTIPWGHGRRFMNSSDTTQLMLVHQITWYYTHSYYKEYIILLSWVPTRISDASIDFNSWLGFALLFRRRDVFHIHHKHVMPSCWYLGKT